MGFGELGSYHNKTFYTFSSVFSVKLSTDWINKFFFYFFVSI